jgi:hypothetical protein
VEAQGGDLPCSEALLDLFFFCELDDVDVIDEILPIRKKKHAWRASTSARSLWTRHPSLSNTCFVSTCCLHLNKTCEMILQVKEDFVTIYELLSQGLSLKVRVLNDLMNALNSQFHFMKTPQYQKKITFRFYLIALIHEYNVN